MHANEHESGRAKYIRVFCVIRGKDFRCDGDSSLCSGLRKRLGLRLVVRAHLRLRYAQLLVFILQLVELPVDAALAE